MLDASEASAIRCRIVPYWIKAAPRAAPLARRQRRALPWEARPPHAGPQPQGGQIEMAHTSHRPGAARSRLPRS